MISVRDIARILKEFDLNVTDIVETPYHIYVYFEDRPELIIEKEDLKQIATYDELREFLKRLVE